MMRKDERVQKDGLALVVVTAMVCLGAWRAQWYRSASLAMMCTTRMNGKLQQVIVVVQRRLLIKGALGRLRHEENGPSHGGVLQ